MKFFAKRKGLIILGLIIFFPLIIIRELKSSHILQYTYLYSAAVGISFFISGFFTLIKKKSPYKISKSSEKELLSYIGINSTLLGILLLLGGLILIVLSIY